MNVLFSSEYYVLVRNMLFLAGLGLIVFGIGCFYTSFSAGNIEIWRFKLSGRTRKECIHQRIVSIFIIALGIIFALSSNIRIVNTVIAVVKHMISELK